MKDAPAVVGALVLALVCAMASLMAAATQLTWLAVVTGVVFFVSLGLVLTVPTATGEQGVQR